MEQKTARTIVYVYASLFALGGLVVLFIFMNTRGGVQLLYLFLIFLFLLQASTSAGLFLRRQWGRILTLVICSIVVLLMILLVIPGSGVRMLWNGAGALAVLIFDTLISVFGLYAFGFNKDVKALFAKPKAKVKA